MLPVHSRKSLCRQTSGECFSKDSDAVSSGSKVFENFRILHSSQRPREGARPEVHGHSGSRAHIAVTRNVCAELVFTLQVAIGGNLSCRVFAIAWNARIATSCISSPSARFATGLISCQRSVALRGNMRCIALAGEEARLMCGDRAT
jgi:hypothetical protein